MMPLEIRALLAAAILAIVAGLGWLAYDTIYDRGYEAAEAAQAIAERAAQIERAVENAAAVKQHEDTNNDLKDRHAKEIADSRARSAAAPRMRVSAEICRGFTGSAEAESAGGGDDRDSATRLVPEGIDEDLRAIEVKIEAVFAGCRTGQSFIREHGMAP